MAEEQFTSRRARREAERRAAEQAFEARENPEQPDDAAPSRADLISPRTEKQTEAGAQRPERESVAERSAAESEDTPTRIDPNPVTGTPHQRGALASDHPLESRPPVSAEDRLDPTRAPLPHFETRAAKKKYLREHGLSLGGDLSTGATPVVASDEELAEREAADSGNLTDTGEDGAQAEPRNTTVEALPEPADADAAEEAQHESYDIAGFGGASDEVAARDFEAPVTAESAPRPISIDDEPYDALSKPFEDVATEADTDEPGAAAENDRTDTTAAGSEADSTPGAAEMPSRSRRMPIVRPPSTSGVRVVTAASAQIPEVAETPTDQARWQQDPEQHGRAEQEDPAPTGSGAAPAHDALDSEDTAGSGTDSFADHEQSDEAARALAANPETRPMDAVPEAWALPNTDYEDEETENPPGDRIRASAVTGQDGRILMGEEPSKVPYIVLGIAGFFALALIIIALVMFL